MVVAFGAVVAFPLSAAAAQRPAVTPPLAEVEARARTDSLDPEAHFQLAVRYYRLKRFDDEERELRATIAIDPRYAPAYLWLGDLPFDRRPRLWRDVRKGKVADEFRPAVEESYRLWRQAFLIDPFVDFRVVGVASPPEEMLAVPEYGRATTDYLLRVGLGAFGAARYELSRSALDVWAQRAFAGKPEDSIPDFLFLYRGLAAAHLRAYNRAVTDIRVLLNRSLAAERADTLLPFPMRTNDYRYIVAVLHHRWGRPADAIRLYEETIAADLGLYMAHVRLAELYRSYKMWDKAISEAQRAVETNPDDPTLLTDLGVILDESGKHSEAVDALERAAAANPRDPRPVYYLGIARQQLGKPAEAREALSRFVAIAPPTARYERELADAKQRLTALPESAPR